MKIYIAGKIGDLPPEVYKPKFEKAAEMIRGYGYTPINPVEITSHLPEGTRWEEYMRICLSAIMDVDAICLLPDWEASRGACIEQSIAAARGIKFFEHNIKIDYTFD